MKGKLALFVLKPAKEIVIGKIEYIEEAADAGIIKDFQERTFASTEYIVLNNPLTIVHIPDEQRPGQYRILPMSFPIPFADGFLISPNKHDFILKVEDIFAAYIEDDIKKQILDMYEEANSKIVKPKGNLQLI